MRVIILKKRTVIKVLVCAIAFVCVFGLVQIGSTDTNAAFSTQTEEELMPVRSIDPQEKKAALTVDTAFGDDYTQQILNTLAEKNCKATFFVMGLWAEENPALVEQIVAGGHEIASHSMHHLRYTDVTAEEMLGDAQAAQKKIAELTGVQTNVIRLPYGAANSAVVGALRSAGFIPVTWSVDAEDWKTDDEKTVYNNVVKNTRGGSIVMLQNNTKASNALGEIIDTLQNKGYTLCTLGELLPQGAFDVDAQGRVIAGKAS